MHGASKAGLSTLMRRCGVIIVLSAWIGAFPQWSYAQLISPGKLMQVHRDLEGMTNCTNCHQLGRPGISNTKCLDCHTPLRLRIDQNTGFHQTVADQNCAECHKDHFGTEFDALRFETESFDHTASTGFDLLGAHQDIECRDCHRTELITAADVKAFKGKHGTIDKTFLGLGTTCVNCHTSDDPHEGQFEDPSCNTCHTEDTWEEAPKFDHNKADFRLRGRHTDVSCDGCHKDVRRGAVTFVQYTDIPFSNCQSCHNDVHEGSFGSNCTQCHNESDWHRLDAFPESTFDHAMTGFELLGSHAEATCASCHTTPARRDVDIAISFVAGTGGATYPSPVAETCLSCHVDFHEGVFLDSDGSAVCDNCHGNDGWLPTSFDLERHNDAADFSLTGAHMATPCSACHRDTNPQPVFHFEDQTCTTCHQDDNTHADQFADGTGVTTCETCHTTETWNLGTSFDHDTTGFLLTGYHQNTTCLDCHKPVADPTGNETIQYRGTATTCEGCHEADNPHTDQFAEVSCNTCHDTDSFFLHEFDHSQARFALDGAHEGVPCGSCHQPEDQASGEVVVRYKPLKFECKDCH